MLRELIHIAPIKTATEQVINCWLSYTMSQPVSFDLTVIGLFLLQYMGVTQVQRFVRVIRKSNGNIPNAGVDPDCSFMGNDPGSNMRHAA